MSALERGERRGEGVVAAMENKDSSAPAEKRVSAGVEQRNLASEERG